MSEETGPRRSSRATTQTSTSISDSVAASKKSTAQGKKRKVDDSAGTTSEQDSTTKAESKKAKADDEPLDLEPIEIGSPLPELILKSDQDEDIDVATLASDKKGVVIFIVPKADTPGCTTQACAFRDIYPSFVGLPDSQTEGWGYEVYCLSADSPAAQMKWKTKKTLPYPLISDPQRQLIKALGASPSAGKSARSHFIFERQNKDDSEEAQLILIEKNIGVKPVDSPRLVQEFLVKHLDIEAVSTE